jgi:DNA-directed RNA polymerase subunit H (RpoH/RPB5)
MTIEKFYETLELVSDLDTELGLQSVLDIINSSLANLVNSPAAPTHQSALANSLASFSDASEKLGKRLSPAQSSLIAEIGGGDFFDPLMADKVQASVSANAMTPSVAKGFVADLATRRTTFLATVRQTIQGLAELNVKAVSLKPGTADMTFLIPRELFENQLGPFAKELTIISRLIQDFSEAVTGNIEDVELETLSSSIPTVAVLASAKVVEAIANIVNKFLEAWEKIEKIRRLRGELSEVGMTGTALDELTEKIETTVEEIIEESTQLTLKGYKGTPERKNELETALKQDTHRLFGQIERGLTIQFAAKPDPQKEDADNKALQAVDHLSHKMQFPQIKADPILLTTGEILGELHTVRVTRKSTTTTITSKGKKKESRKE